jgi:serine/threonine protein kinase
MGTVYLATQLSRGRVVALKVLSANLSQDEAFNKRFRREAMLQATPAHPHIVPVYESGESGYGLFIAMRLVDGPSMKELIGSGGDHAYLADFGLTTAPGVTSMTTTGQFVDTPDYASPEQIRDENVAVAVRDSIGAVSQAYRHVAAAAKRGDLIDYTVARAEVPARRRRWQRPLTGLTVWVTR